MNGLKRLAALQERVYEFLAQQDEATLEALLDGSAQLTVTGLPEDLSKLKVEELKALAKKRGLRGYSKLLKAELIDRLLGHRAAAPPVEPPPAPAALRPVVTAPAAPAPRPVPTPQAVTARPGVDAAAIAVHLRETDTEEEGAVYLEAQRLDRDSLLAVATELQLTRVDRLSQKELKRRILKQAIGARRKFAGLRKW
ncbi:Rho termination factor N-terminal domain-containing protein [Amycolatopsis sp. Hca4]|uniref:Rho termination factor N-terminal domain-containing protein n=1 Tax=Amycolatopsis sp. Hca4 TaxID=2742131 RepID=UPI00158FA7D4|nr:Rho termination factor N-terminal domain-containing protein [Amycolatopsis sp. Hca4]QKV78070.1 Rho termination factor N-terminal domain-containing protein [Amycolatopsis sp. Hca4]